MFRAVLLLSFALSSIVQAADPKPRLITISPTRGSTLGGTLVELHGEHFDLLPAGTLGVLFGYDPSPSVQYVSPELIRAVSPPHQKGNFYVKVSVNGDPLTGYGRRSFVFVEESGSTTTTTTTTIPGTTTTTLQCVACADADPCTVDTCTLGNQCAHRMATTLTDLVGQAPACASDQVPVRIAERYVLGCDMVVQGQQSQNPGIAKRRFRSAIHLFGRAARGARKSVERKSGISDACGASLQTVLDGARNRAKALKGP